MNDVLYEEHLVQRPHREIMAQLRRALPDCQLWLRFENFNRKVSGAALNTKTNAAAILTLLDSGTQRTALLTTEELQAIKSHVVREDAPNDFSL
jgi:hypothetical protein